MKAYSYPKSSLALLFCFLALASSVFARVPSARKDSSADPVVHTANPDTMRIEGEKRFHANCGRCHAAPTKFPPRVMGTVLRHMRVRATVTNEDQRLILFYMTQ